MEDFLSKPVDIYRLADMLAKWLPGTDSRRGVHTADPDTPEQAVAIFDSEALLNRLMGDRPLAARILQGFIADFPSQLNNLGKRLAEADAPGARLQAHALKGSAAAVSAESLRAVALEMERAAGAGELGHFGDLLPRAAEEFERLKTTLEHAGWL
jgi:HPt (histidine-containing phosphotransfer) domain-containing protein